MMAKHTTSNLAIRLRLYLIADFGGRDEAVVLEAVRCALEAGVTALQYRDKAPPSAERRLWRAETLRDLAREHGALFIINDDVELALSVGADGVHIGPDDQPPPTVRARVGPNFVIGASCGTPERAEQLSDADYLGVGAIYDARPTKPNASAPRGVDIIRSLSRHASQPLVGIGGITPDNYEAVLVAGAAGVAVIRCVLDAEDPAVIVRSLGLVADEDAWSPGV